MSEAPERIWAFPKKGWFDAGASTRRIKCAGARDVEYIRADLARPKVKPLQWVDLSESYKNWYYADDSFDWYYADTSFGGYRIRQQFFPGPCFVVVTPTELRISENTLEEAKASAQRDYNRRILDALY